MMAQHSTHGHIRHILQFIQFTERYHYKQSPRALPAYYQVPMRTCAEVSPTAAQAVGAVPDLAAGKVPQTILQDD